MQQSQVAPVNAPRGHVGAHSTAGGAEHSENANRRLGPLLCWAVVFADIGTSVYYVPGILYTQVGRLAGLFVVMTLLVFLLLTLKYAEVSVRFPEGGGVVTVAARGLNPWAGAVGGMFILVDYFLTSAISSLSGLNYLSTLVPFLRGGFTILVVTLTVVALLGLLNWYGITESAKVSLIIAIAAFISDMLILITLFVTVPLSTIGKAFQEIFSGEHLSGTVILTGFAGAFLAFSGLESISQLSPVMRAPRTKTVSVALAIVVITVGITSPLLTIFSTTLLDITHDNPNTIISTLAGFSGGDILRILTSITASTLLIFASNTAIIGAYHVFLALSRMHFFPSIVERTNKMRGTPHVSILLATGIPMLILVAVLGRIDILGDMYAFGLLGAFSLTCISLDVIRWRERHGGVHIGDTGEAEMRYARAHRNLPSLPALQYLLDRVDPMTMERLWHLRRRVQMQRQAATKPLAKAWPNLRYYLGFITTFFVVIAWSVNLVSKPAATAFGGGLTIIGVGISIWHYRYQRAHGNTPIFLMPGLRRMPDAVLVVLSPRSKHNPQIIRAAVESAEDRTLVFLYLAHATTATPTLRAFQIADPFADDEDARRLFSQAATLTEEEHIRAEYLYRIGGPGVVSDVWRTMRPGEIVGEASLAKILSMRVAPEYVRYQYVDGVRVAHYVKHLGAADLPTDANATPANAASGANGANGRTTPIPHRIIDSEPAPFVQHNGHGHRHAPAQTPANEQEEPSTEMPTVDTDGQAGVDLDDYVWTGTQLVRRSELPVDLAEDRDDDSPADSNGNTPTTQPDR